MQTTLTIISIFTAFIAVFVAINVAYNFYSIHDFQKRLRQIESIFKDEVSKIETNVNTKIDQVDIELNKYKELSKGYVDIMYQVHSANANLSFNDKRYFEAIVHELKNIYHITKHKSDFSDKEFNEFIGVKYWFIAQDILKYKDDRYINSKEDGERNKALERRNEIIQICENIEKHPNAIDVDNKFKVVRRVLPTLIDDMYYYKPINPFGGDWEKIRELAK